MLSLEGRWVFITGASRGIGSLIALFMARQGCNLVLHSRDRSHTRPILHQLKDLGVEACDVEADLANPESVELMLDEIEALGMDVDVVFNNAGVQVAYRKRFWETPVDDFTTSFQINLIAPAMICYRLIPKMIQRGFGRVINITSSIMNEPEQAGYSASKAALDKFTRDLGSKLEGGPVSINLADPGWCSTDLGGASAPNLPQSALPGVALGAFMSDQKNGRIFRAQEYSGMSLQQAIEKAESKRPE